MWSPGKDYSPCCNRTGETATANFVETGDLTIPLAVKLAFELCVRYWRRSPHRSSMLAVEAALDTPDEGHVAHMLTLFDQQVAEHIRQRVVRPTGVWFQCQVGL